MRLAVCIPGCALACAPARTSQIAPAGGLKPVFVTAADDEEFTEWRRRLHDAIYEANAAGGDAAAAVDAGAATVGAEAGGEASDSDIEEGS